MSKYTFRKEKKPKDRLWEVFSKFIRLRDSNNGMIKCCSCSRVVNWKESHAAHYFPKSTHKGIMYDERNVNASCYTCNMSKGYNHATIESIKARYSITMIRKYGAKVFDELAKLNRKPKQLKTFQIQALIQEYQGKIRELEN